MDGLRTWLERWTVAQYLGASAVVVVVPAVLVAVLDLPWSVVSGAVSAIALVGAVTGWALRQQAARLPLTLASSALRGRVDGRTVYRFRVVLGRGRPMDEATAVVVFRPATGATVELVPLVAGGRRLLGPWTVAVIDRADACVGEGEFHVQVTARERDRRWEASATWRSDEVQDGRFAEAVAVRGGKLAFKLEDFEAIAPE